MHCNAGTHGAEIHSAFTTDIKNPAQRPNDNTVYYKGENDSVEEYSAFEAKNKAGRKICDEVGGSLVVCGIASEFCVRESVLALLKSGRKIAVPEDMLAWVDEANHRKNIAELSSMGVQIV